MTAAVPLIVPQARSAAAIAKLLEARLEGLGFVGEDPLRKALVRIGARYGEVLIEHLNAAPRRHLDTFLGCLGTQPAPATPATVALCFTPVVGAGAAAGAIGAHSGATGMSLRAIVVPAHTPVAAPPSGGDTEDVCFETERELEVVRAAPTGAWAIDPQALRWADVGGLMQPAGFDGEHLFVGAQAIESAFHISAPRVFGLPHLRRVRVELTVLRGATWPPGGGPLWGIVTDAGFEPLRVESDSTQQFARSGVVELVAPAEWPTRAIGGVESMWLVCRLANPAPRGAASTLPHIAAPRVGALAQGEGEAPLAVYWGNVALDTSRDFFPFGERPRFGDMLHVMATALDGPGARVVIDVLLTNPSDGPDDPLPKVDPSGKPRVQWEAHTSRGWVALDARDTTKSLTLHGDVSFTLPDDVQPFVLAGQRGAWVRARLVSGHYGAPKLIDGLPFPAAPSIRSLLLHSTVDIAPQPAALLCRAGTLELERIDPATATFEPFAPPDVEGPALYIAVEGPEPLQVGRRLSLHIEPGRQTRRAVRRDTTAASKGVRWQMRSADGWRDCRVVDESSNLERPGSVVFELPAAPTAWPGSSVLPSAAACWLRVVWLADAPAPCLRRIVMNAARARQTLRLRHELLGSSTGRPGQTFVALRAPIFGDVVLQVRDAAAPPTAWRAWQEVADFTASDAHSTHFSLDRRTGQVRFGNGAKGRIPPAGANNIRLLQYHVGGGRRGNVAAGAVAQLRTAVPYVQAVTNPEPAVGGQDAGDAASMQRAASGWLRHRDRAVCADDYVDLCCAASPEVARAWCIGNRDLDASAAARLAPGVVSLIVLPHAAQARPQPSSDLLARIEAFLDARRPLNTELVLLGPEYVSQSVQARVAAGSGWTTHEVAQACRRRLIEYLHPIDGGDAGDGWAPGQRPHRSDLVALVGAVDGVDHVVELRASIDESQLDADRRALALVCPGTIEVTA